MSRKAVQNSNIWRALLSLLIGAAVYALLCLLTAYGIQNEWFPMETMHAAAPAALIVSAAAIAVVGRGGRECVLLGVSYAALYLIWRFASCGMQAMVSETGIGVLICALCPWVFSCIFHKSKRSNTKRNRKVRR